MKKAREAGADVVVAYISWGQVGVRELGESEFNAATALAQAGVDVLIGFHPHTVIPPRWFDVQLEDGTSHRMLCLCATGNFLSDQRDQLHLQRHRLRVHHRGDFRGRVRDHRADLHSHLCVAL